MFTSLVIDGVLKIVQVIRYKNKPAVARVYDPRAVVPETILQASKYDDDRFIDDDCREYRLTDTGLVTIK